MSLSSSGAVVSAADGEYKSRGQSTPSPPAVDSHQLPNDCSSGIDGSAANGITLTPSLLDLVRRTGYPLRQENGQRRYGPPSDWAEPIPGRGCEVFVGKLPRDSYEDELVPIFERFGRIYELRLMMDFSGSTRGYCFVMFSSRAEARRAINEADDLELRPGRCIGVCPSVDNCRLFVGGLPRNRRRDEILVEMRRLAEGVRDVIVYPDARDKSRNRGFAFVEFASHSDAAKARRSLLGVGVQLWGQTLAIDWAEPEAEPDDDVMSKVKILYVRNLMLDTTEETVERFFSEAVTHPGGSSSASGVKDDQQIIERVKKIRDYAFVHFRDREEALLAMERTNGKEIDGSVIEVVLAKPADKSRQRQSRTKFSSEATQVSGIPVFAAAGSSIVQAHMATLQTNNSILMTSANRELQQSSRAQSASLKSRSSLGATVTNSVRSSFLPYKKPLPSADGRFCNYLMPNVELLYANPPMIIQPPMLQSAIQMLEELSVQSGYGSPIYQIFACLHEGLQMFTYKLTVAGKEFIVNAMSQSPEEAQTNVAMLALKSLTEVPLSSIPPLVISPPVQFTSPTPTMGLQGQVYACPMSPSGAGSVGTISAAHVHGSNTSGALPTYQLLTQAPTGALSPGATMFADYGMTGVTPMIFGHPGLQFLTADRSAQTTGQLTAAYLPTLTSYGV